MKSVTLVLGGARSGKSRFAEGLGRAAPGPKTYIATAEAFDQDMRERISRHRQQRGEGWTTLEAPLDLVPALKSGGEGFVLVECLTMWLNNLIYRERDVEAEVGELCAALTAMSGDVVLVSNEVGYGIVPENPLARRFRDEQGLANQRVAAVADKVYLVAAGLSLPLKR